MNTFFSSEFLLSRVIYILRSCVKYGMCSSPDRTQRSVCGDILILDCGFSSGDRYKDVCMHQYMCLSLWDEIETQGCQISLLL